MTEKIDEGTANKEELKPAGLKSQGRRQAVKTIVGTVTALTAYNVLPARWDSPIIEQIFLPAHAATSGCSESSLLGDWSARGTENSNYPVDYFTLASGGTATNVTDGDNTAQPNGSWSLSGNTLTVVLPRSDPDFGNFTITYVLTVSDCSSYSGTGTVTMNNGVESISMGAAAPTTPRF